MSLPTGEEGEISLHLLHHQFTRSTLTMYLLTAMGGGRPLVISYENAHRQAPDLCQPAPRAELSSSARARWGTLAQQAQASQPLAKAFREAAVSAGATH